MGLFTVTDVAEDARELQRWQERDAFERWYAWMADLAARLDLTWEETEAWLDARDRKHRRAYFEAAYRGDDTRECGCDWKAECEHVYDPDWDVDEFPIYIGADGREHGEF